RPGWSRRSRPGPRRLRCRRCRRGGSVLKRTDGIRAMNVCEVFIQRPIATSLLMAGIALIGGISYTSLPVSDLPTVDYPTVQVGASLPGGDPATMASTVASPLERQFTTIAGVDEMTSSSSAGSTSITLSFDLDRNVD